MNITDWDSAGIDWDEPEASNLYDVFESIRLALLERLSITGIDFEDLPPVMKNIRVRSAYEVAREFHRNISSVIPRFADHTDKSGNWNNQVVIPAWTEKSILDEIGAPERVPVSRLGLSAEWVIQTYKILNLLKWGRFECSGGGNYMTVRRGEVYEYDNGHTWSDAKTAFYAADWIEYGSSGTAGIISMMAAFPRYRITSIRSKFKIPISKYHQCTKEFYYSGFSYGQPVNGVYFHNVILTDDWSYKYTLFKTENEGEGDEDGEYFIFTDEELLNTDLLEPAYGNANLTAYVTYIDVGASVIISKFDGPNGFKFLTRDE